jgi:5-methylcytosine-specific restriction endonuclease McrA
MKSKKTVSKAQKKKKEFTLQPAILGALRRLFRRWPAYIAIKNENKKEYFVKSKTGKPMRRVGYVCNYCGTLANNKDCAVDHVLPCVCPNEGFVNYELYIKRLFCDKDNLQILCKSCHDLKSKEENKQRRMTREKKKTTTNKPKPTKRKKK